LFLFNKHKKNQRHYLERERRNKRAKIKRQSYSKLEKKSGDLKTKALLNRVKSRPFYRIMAPFKLFRSTTSRSTSQENEPDQQPTPNLVVTSSLNKLTTAISTSSAHNNYINIDESDQTSENSSLMSLNNDQRALLSAGSTADQIGNFYLSYLYFMFFYLFLFILSIV
jgi:hypothetical protein